MLDQQAAFCGSATTPRLKHTRASAQFFDLRSSSPFVQKSSEACASSFPSCIAVATGHQEHPPSPSSSTTISSELAVIGSLHTLPQKNTYDGRSKHCCKNQVLCETSFSATFLSAVTKLRARTVSMGQSQFTIYTLYLQFCQPYE